MKDTQLRYNTLFCVDFQDRHTRSFTSFGAVDGKVGAFSTSSNAPLWFKYRALVNWEKIVQTTDKWIIVFILERERERAAQISD